MSTVDFHVLNLSLSLVLEATVPQKSRWLFRRLKEFPAGKPLSVHPLFWELPWGEETVPCSIFVWLAARQRPSHSVVQISMLESSKSAQHFTASCWSAIQARSTQHLGRASWHLMQSHDNIWKCRKACCMAILKSRVPQRRPVSGGMAVEHASTASALHLVVHI
jgi:hypothetical protein